MTRELGSKVHLEFEEIINVSDAFSFASDPHDVDRLRKLAEIVAFKVDVSVTNAVEDLRWQSTIGINDSGQQIDATSDG